MPAVTVIMPFHRLTPFLRPAVRSILDQTWRDFELILVDNGTGGGEAALAEEGRDERVRFVTLPRNEGVAAAHNAARAQARGEFIANMDSDDIALPTRLERQVATLRAEPQLALLATHALIIDEKGRVTGSQFTLATERDQRVFSAYSLPVTNPTVMGRREVFAEFPMRGEFVVSSDYDFFARVIDRHACRALPEVLLHYRRHGGQMTVRRHAAMVLNACLIRVITARRRAGRPEDMTGLLASLPGWLAEPPPVAIIYAHFAQLALGDDLPLLAVFFARRSFGAQRHAAALGRATAVLTASTVRAPMEAARLVRMFLTGPVRTHALQPVR